MENKKKIFIVDDEEANIFMLEGILSSEGFDVKSASNGLECLELLRSNYSPDLILLDIMMPELNGLDTLRKLKQNHIFNNIPVIMISALTDGDNIETALSLGALEYIKKPIDEIELLARIDTVIKIKEQETELKNNLKIKDDFIRMISHDLRTPFTTISGFAQILLEDVSLKLNEEQRETLNYIYGSSDFVIDYFNKMLAWSNIGQRELILEKEITNLKDIIKNVVLTFKPRLNKKNIDLKVNIPEFPIDVDVTYFTNAVNNIVSNAIKYTKQGGDVKIFLSNENSKNILNISDSGVGIDLEKKTLFSSKLNKSTIGTDGEKGTGTGIYITKKIIDSHGFGLDFESTPGKGTTFKLIL